MGACRLLFWQGKGFDSKVAEAKAMTDNRVCYDVVVIGGGVVGCAIARELSRYKLRLALLEKEAEVGFGTSKANSGIVHAGFHSEPGTLKARFVVPGNKLYDRWKEELDIEFERNGVLMVARPEQESLLHEYLERGRVNGVPRLRIVNQQELHEMEPNLAPDITAGLYAPTGGVVSPADLTMALAENASDNGVDVFTGAPVHSVQTTDRGFFVVRAGCRRLEARYVVNAAGLYADQVARLVGDDSFSIRPRKGEEYLLDKRLEGLVKSTVFPVPTKVSKGILVIPTVHGNIMLGPTAEEIESRDDLATSSTGFAEVLAGVQRLVPSVQPRDIITSFTGIRAASDHGDFVIEPSPAVRGWVNVAGIESPGLTAAPAIAEYVVHLVKELGLELVEDPTFNPRRRPVIRFRELSHEERKSLIRRDPLYGRIICRCETVTEAEIRDAIRRGARTLDGVKWRTRAGMGRCQGGFCTARVIELLAEELGVSEEQVTKRGPGSELLLLRTKEPLLQGGGIQ